MPKLPPRYTSSFGVHSHLFGIEYPADLGNHFFVQGAIFHEKKIFRGCVQEEGYTLDLEYTLSGNVDAAAFDPARKEFFMDQNQQRTYTISEVVEQTGLSADTLRFYEKIGLLGSPERGGGRQRMYTSVDIGKIRFVSHLKRTHMPLKKIREYVRRYNEQDETGCYDLLDEHRQSIEQQIDELKETLQIIGFKLKHFQEIKDGK